MDIFEAARACSIVGEYERTGNKLKGKNGVLRGVCPICGGSNPTEFIVFESANNFFCHRCGAKGDVITFKSVIEGTDLQTTAENLCKENGIPIDDKTTKFSHQRKQTKKKQDEELTAALSGAADAFEEKAKLAIEKPVGDKLTENAEMARAAASYEFNEVDPNSSIEFKIHALHIVGETETADEICAKYGDATSGSAAAKTKRRHFVDLSQVEDEDRTPFIWFPYIPVDEVTLLSAETKVGKGFFCTMLAALLSRGYDFTFQEYHRCPEGRRAFTQGEAVRTMFLTDEDGAERIKPRYLSSGGNIDFLDIVDGRVLDDDDKPLLPKLNFTKPEGLNRFRELIDEAGAKLCVIDPIDDFTGNANLNNREEVRAIIRDVRNIAREKHIAIIIIHHTKKRGRGDADYAENISGSHAFREVVRSVLAIEYDPEDPKAVENPKDTDFRIMMHIEVNHGRIGKTVRFKIKEDERGRPGAHFAVSDSELPTFSDVTPDVFRLAAMRGTTPGALMRQRKFAKEAENEKYNPLREAVGSEVEKMRKNGEVSRKYSYPEFEKLHGAEIWCGEKQPKAAFERITDYCNRNEIGIHTNGVRKGQDRGFEIVVKSAKTEG